jgi:MFS family permease
MTSVTTTRPSTFSVFRNRNFSLMWTGQLVSTAGSALTSLTAGILVYRLTGSALSVGLLLMATALPALLIGWLAGVLVDRVDRRHMMLSVDLVRAVLVVLIPLLIPSNLAWLYILVGLASAAGQFFDPAHASLLPELATDEELAAANSMMTISTVGAQAIGFSLAGLIASSLSAEWAFAIDAVTFLFSALCINRIRVASCTTAANTSAAGMTHHEVARYLQAGVTLIGRTPALRSLFLVYLLAFITFGLDNALMLPFARRALQASEAEYGLLEGITLFGLAAGSFMMARYSHRLREGQWIAFSFIGMALSSIIYSQLHAVSPALIILTLNYALNAPSAVGRQLIIQRHAPREMRGRVFSAFFVLRDTMFVLGMLLAGLADSMDVRMLYLLQSLAFLAVGALAMALPGLGQPAGGWKRIINGRRGQQVASALAVQTNAALHRLTSLANGGASMKHSRLFLNLFVVAWLSGVLVAPVASPIITPRATLRTIIACQGQTAGTIVVTDSRGHTTTQTCDASLRSMSGYPGLVPTEVTPWQVTITAQPLFSREGLPRTCRSLVTSVPIHVQCAANSPAPLTVDFYMILAF